MSLGANKITNCDIGVNVYVYTASMLLFGSGLAKLISMIGRARILQELDPLIGIKFQYLFALAGSIEMIVALVGFSSKPIQMKVLAIAWVSTSIATYRFGLIWIGYHGACRCLGSLTEALHISSRTADTAMKAALIYLLIGGYTALLLLWQRGNRLSEPASTQ